MEGEPITQHFLAITHILIVPCTSCSWQPEHYTVYTVMISRYETLHKSFNISDMIEGHGFLKLQYPQSCVFYCGIAASPLKF